jgi:hypothetical protein
MTDNFAQFKKYIRHAGIPDSKNYINDKFFTIPLIRRGKDCPDMPAANYTFKIYYIDSIDAYEKAQEEIVILCKNFPLRAYISVNCKSKAKAQVRVLTKISQAIEMGETKKPWKMFATACDEIENKEDKRWIVDIDTKDDYSVDLMKMLVKSCDSKYNPEEIIIEEVNTRGGIHLITRPFNLKQFNEKFLEIKEQAIKDIEKPEIKKNHLTLLYEDLPST